MKAWPVLMLAVLIVAVTGCSRQPPTIIHLCDYHFVSRDDFSADLRAQDVSLNEAEIGRRYAEFLDSVESVQVDQVATLRCLIRQHGIRHVFKEGVTGENVDAFRRTVDEFVEVDLPAMHESLKNTEDTTEQILLLVTIEDLRGKRLQLGAIGQLMLTGELKGVEPLDNAGLMEAADPTKNGLRFNGPENTAREKERARRLVNAGPVSVVILGAAHNLEPEIKRLNPAATYQRILPTAYTRAVETQRNDASY